MSARDEPAFAALATSPMGDVHHQPGLTKREWLAGQALVGLLSARAPSITDIPASALRPLAQTAARIADAIIEELKE